MTFIWPVDERFPVSVVDGEWQGSDAHIARGEGCAVDIAVGTGNQTRSIFPWGEPESVTWYGLAATPCGGQFDYWGKEPITGISTIKADGHTPGHTAFAIANGGVKLLVMSDTTNNPLLFARNPTWTAVFDMDGDTAIATRKRLLDMAATDKMQVSFYHAAFPATGHIAKQGGGNRYFMFDPFKDIVARAERTAIPQAVAVLNGAGEHVGDRLNPAVRMPREPRSIVFRGVAAEVVKEQEWVKFGGVAEAEAPAQPDARALDVGLRFGYLFHGSD